jgi:glyoxylase-like metal-dependent hydrolase (beta-lactamase superfamily II)
VGHRRGDGIVLVDTGMHEPGSFAHLERALHQVRLRVENVRLLVCTHAHADHYGQAAAVVERSGCELWMHPAHQHMLGYASDPDAALSSRVEVARQSGVPEAPLAAYAEARKGENSGSTASSRRTASS